MSKNVSGNKKIYEISNGVCLRLLLSLFYGSFIFYSYYSVRREIYALRKFPAKQYGTHRTRSVWKARRRNVRVSKYYYVCSVQNLRKLRYVYWIRARSVHVLHASHFRIIESEQNLQVFQVGFFYEWKFLKETVRFEYTLIRFVVAFFGWRKNCRNK